MSNNDGEEFLIVDALVRSGIVKLLRKIDLFFLFYKRIKSFLKEVETVNFSPALSSRRTCSLRRSPLVLYQTGQFSTSRKPSSLISPSASSRWCNTKNRS